MLFYSKTTLITLNPGPSQAVLCLMKKNAKVLVSPDVDNQSIIHAPYTYQLTPITAKKDLGIWIASELTWCKHVLDQCARANKLLGFVKRCSEEKSDMRTRQTLYLSLVRSVFGYSSQVLLPQTVTLIQRVEWVQSRATKYILILLYLNDSSVWAFYYSLTDMSIWISCSFIKR